MSIVLKKIFLYVCWMLGGFHVSRYLMKNKLQILCYHGFETNDESSFRPKLFIKKNTFSRRLELISKYDYQVLPLNSALNKLRNNKLPDNTIAITIDDGFYSVLNVAANMLYAYEYPATLYLTTYYVKKNTPIFRLVVQYMFWKTEKQEVNFADCLWNKNNNRDVYIASDQESHRIIWECIDYGEKRCSEPERTKICQQLGSLLAVDYQEICNDRILSLVTTDEARLLANKGFDIQLHTHRHYFPTDDEVIAKKEITDNRKVLEKIVDYPVEHFCYPSGIWNKTQWSWLKELNIKSATTCLPGLNDSKFTAFKLTRFLDGENISEIEFKAELFGFLELIRALRKKIKALTNAH